MFQHMAIRAFLASVLGMAMFALITPDLPTDGSLLHRDVYEDVEAVKAEIRASGYDGCYRRSYMHTFFPGDIVCIEPVSARHEQGLLWAYRLWFIYSLSAVCLLPILGAIGLIHVLSWCAKMMRRTP